MHKHSTLQQQRVITKGGYIALMSVLIVGALGATVVSFMLLTGILGSKTAIVGEEGAQAATFADACAEEALQRIRQNTGYIGTESVVFDDGSCTYTVIDDGGEARSITATGVSDNSIRNVSVTIDQIQPAINSIDWQEVE